MSRLRRIVAHPWVQIQVAGFAIWIVTGAGYDGVAAAAVAWVLALLWWKQGRREALDYRRWQFARERVLARGRERVLERKLERAVDALELVQAGQHVGDGDDGQWCAGVAVSALSAIEETA